MAECMVKRVKQKNYGSIITQLETWESSYYLSSEGQHSDEYFNEHLELFTKVIFSENKRIKEGDSIKFYVVVEHDMENRVKPPKHVSCFDRSKKCRTAFLAVHKTFIDNFRFLINCGIKPYISVLYSIDENSYINITSLYLTSSVEIDEYRTC